MHIGIYVNGWPHFLVLRLISDAPMNQIDQIRTFHWKTTNRRRLLQRISSLKIHSQGRRTASIIGEIDSSK